MPSIFRIFEHTVHKFWINLVGKYSVLNRIPNCIKEFCFLQKCTNPFVWIIQFRGVYRILYYRKLSPLLPLHIILLLC